jgi:hypothetical protein
MSASSQKLLAVNDLCAFEPGMTACFDRLSCDPASA